MNTKDKIEQPLLDSNQCVQESKSCALPLGKRALFIIAKHGTTIKISFCFFN